MERKKHFSFVSVKTTTKWFQDLSSKAESWDQIGERIAGCRIPPRLSAQGVFLTLNLKWTYDLFQNVVSLFKLRREESVRKSSGCWNMRTRIHEGFSTATPWWILISCFQIYNKNAGDSTGWSQKVVRERFLIMWSWSVSVWSNAKVLGSRLSLSVKDYQAARKGTF